MPSYVAARSGGFKYIHNSVTYTFDVKVCQETQNTYREDGWRKAILDVKPAVHAKVLFDLADALMKEEDFKKWIRVFMEPKGFVTSLEKVLEVVKDSDDKPTDSLMILRDHVDSGIDDMTRLTDNWMKSL